MRVLLSFAGALGLLAGLYLGLAPRLGRPVLRLALELEAGNVDDAALAEGVALAFEERGERAGRWRVATAHQTRRSGRIDLPTTRAHTMMYGLERPEVFPGPEGPLLFNEAHEGAAICAWMARRNLTRLSTYHPALHPSTRLRGEDDPRLTQRPDALYLNSHFGFQPGDIEKLRQAGFEGHIFVSPSRIAASALASLEGGLLVLSPLKATPPGFHLAHPFAYVGYRGALLYLDALDANPHEDPLRLARDFPKKSLFTELMDEPRVYEVKGGRLVELK